MSKLSVPLTVLGGSLILFGLLGLYVVLKTDEYSYFELWEQDLSLVATPLRNWYWFLALGLLFVHLGNGVHPVGHSCQLVEGLSAQPSAIYEAVCVGLDQHEVPGYRAYNFSQRQRGLFSARRWSLRITRGHIRFDLCAAPFGKDFGVSWRCYGKMGLWERALVTLPVLGWLPYFLFFRYTTYAEDRGRLFQASVHQRIRDTIQHLNEQQGLRALSESEFQPVLADMFRRW